MATTDTTYQTYENIIEETAQSAVPSERNDIWTTRCGTFSNEHVKYIVQVAFGTAVVAFSMVQIIRKDGDVGVYYSMLSGTLGLFLPSPGISKPP